MFDQYIRVPVIGTVVGGHSGRLDDFKGNVESIIRLAPSIPESALQGIEEFSHLQVIWHFSLGSDADIELPPRSPRDNPAWPATGGLVHRNHRRPARLGTSFPRLLRVDGRDLHVEDLDADDGTPVIDLVPVFKEMMPRGPVYQPAWPTEMLSDYWESAEKRP
ncbi:TrmO family methyltransferase domain-containing protein [Streptomyces chromofuscus]|uniref:SAM-dependent methyltransferase n=1 Tax=Streptomyces chromofuscus TaxID=42881 RepID=A0A7M2T585_STRCW|nr:TrmO family methyltransferase [Streptomyces chromofuscus]QOV43063.1 SAM-dependent methyltransferase [Streptomyces chromofuscus]GGS93485.1 tRNA (N6-threonylcarbamoyladenosine(37)-N6)-methyltransferase TrmO [Streptomyces chromofuscus]